MQRADGSGGRRRELAAALDLLQQLLATEPVLVDGSRPSQTATIAPSLGTLAARAPGSPQ